LLKLCLENNDILERSVATHVRCGGSFSNSIITNFLLILTMKKVWKLVTIWWSYKAYKLFGPPCTSQKFTHRHLW